MEKSKKVLKITGLVFVIILIYLFLLPFLVIQLGKHKVYTDAEIVPEYYVAIVFGAGIKDNKIPNDMLRHRLDTVSELYYNGKVEKMILSGDHSAIDYNEPQVMYDYLTNEKDIEGEDLIKDFAGSRTYDTCARAKNIWDIDKAILISQGYHLSRAIFTCENLGIESSGFSATKEEYEGRTFYKIREILAIHKAIWDVFISTPDYVKSTLEPNFVE